MNLFQALKMSYKKITFSKGKSLFVIIPIALMFAIIVVAASEANNLITVAHNAIFSPIAGQNEVLEIAKSQREIIQQAFSDTSDAGYSSTDIANITSISNVEKASLVSKLPIDIIKTSDLFDGKKITIDNLAGLDSEYSKLYTAENFTYTEGQAIPIILNANDFVEIYEDWGDKTEITIDFSRQGNASQSNQGPVKARAVSYSRDDLIGKTFTIQFGGLTELDSFKQEPSSSGFKYTKKTVDELTTETNTRKDAIAKYWDYEKISQPITYTFVVVGVSEGSDKTTAYIPSTFATQLLKDYLSNAVAARNGTAIPSSDWNATYVGLVYDGVALQEDPTSQLFAGLRNQVTAQVKDQFNSVNNQINSANSQIRRANSSSSGTHQGGPGAPPQVAVRIGSIGSLNPDNVKITFPGSTTSYSIPGLVYQKDRTAKTITDVYTTFDFSKAVPLASDTLLVKLKNIDVREEVVSDLNAKGYNYQDYSKYKEFSTLENYLHLILNIGSVVFMVITALFILINMAKFVSEGRKEIGIFRAIGASKGNIRTIFIFQSLLFIIFSIILGGALGALAVLGLSNVMVSSAQQFITSTLGSSITLSHGVSAVDFIAFDLQMIAIYSGVLLLVTLVVSLIPSEQAAKVSPVEAIRNS